MNSLHGHPRIFAGNASRRLAADIAAHLGLELDKCEISKFSDGEISVNIAESVRGCDCFIIQSTCEPVNDNLMELLILIDALRRSSAERVTAVIPYFGYARQDRKAKSHDPISSRLVADMITVAGADRVLTMDIHAQQIQGFFKIPMDHLVGAPTLATHFLDRIKNGSSDDFVCLSPDFGSVSRARHFAHQLMDCPIAIVDKRRPRNNVSEVMNLIGDVKGKHVLILDDMIDTAGTLRNAAVAVTEAGALSVSAAATHGVLSGKAIENIENSPLSELVLLDTIELPEHKRSPKIKVLSTAEYFARAIECVHNDHPMTPMINSLYDQVCN
ncbi:MAG: ribose-phosphate pyrophosphokinase [Ruminococcaceae bacterium]|nr:ribose-phosphate pyrophosphokinase [Oscillospiraceae bacterium]